jgi:hypothetical protein
LVKIALMLTRLESSHGTIWRKRKKCRIRLQKMVNLSTNSMKMKIKNISNLLPRLTSRRRISKVFMILLLQLIKLRMKSKREAKNLLGRWTWTEVQPTMCYSGCSSTKTIHLSWLR